MKPFNITNDPREEQNLVFDSSDLSECLEYYKETGDISYLETAISLNYTKIRKSKEMTSNLRDLYQTLPDKHYTTKMLNKILTELK